MKRNRILIWSIILVVLCANVIYADEENSLDAVGAAIQVIENDSSLKASAEALDSALERLNNAKMSPGNYVNVISSEYQANMSQRAVLVKENSVRLDVYQKYINILKASYNLEIQKVILSQAEQRYKAAQLKSDLGIISIKALELIEAQYTKEKLQLQIKERNLEVLIVFLNVKMGQEARTPYSNFMDHNLIPSMEILSLHEYLDSAAKSRADILDLKEQLPVKEAERKFAVYTHQDMDDPFYAQIDYEIENIKNEIETKTIDIEMEVQAKYEEITSSLRTLKDANDAMLEAAENLELTRLKSDMGIISETDRQEVELAYINAKYAFKSAQTDAWFLQEQMNCISSAGK